MTEQQQLATCSVCGRRVQIAHTGPAGAFPVWHYPPTSSPNSDLRCVGTDKPAVTE
jgi:hypothetical protein